MNLKRVRQFICLTETLNYSRAAKKLGVSQPALTKSMMRLEEEAGAALLERHGRKTKLTQFGQIMLEHFKQMNRAAEIAEQAASTYGQGNVQQIRIGIVNSVSSFRFAKFFAKYRKNHTDIEVMCLKLDPEEIELLMLRGEIDCALTANSNVNAASLKTHSLYSEDLVVAFQPGNALEKLRKASITDVMAHPYLDRQNCEFRSTYFNAAAEAGLSMQIAGRSNSESWILKLVAAGVGVTIAPRDSVSLGNLDIRPLTAPKLKRDICIMHPVDLVEGKPTTRFLASLRRFNWAKHAPGSKVQAD